MKGSRKLASAEAKAERFCIMQQREYANNQRLIDKVNLRAHEDSDSDAELAPSVDFLISPHHRHGVRSPGRSRRQLRREDEKDENPKPVFRRHPEEEPTALTWPRPSESPSRDNGGVSDNNIVAAGPRSKLEASPRSKRKPFSAQLEEIQARVISS